MVYKYLWVLNSYFVKERISNLMKTQKARGENKPENVLSSYDEENSRNVLLTFGNPFQKKNSGFCAARRSLFLRARRNQKLPDFSNASEGGFKHVLSRMTAKSTILGSRSRTSCLRARFRCVDAARPSPCRAAKITLIQLLCQSKLECREPSPN